MPWAFLGGPEIEDPEKTIEALLERGTLRAVEGGWLIEDTTDDDDRRHAAQRRRQARYRARKRGEKVTRGDAGEVTRGDAQDAGTFDEIAGATTREETLEGFSLGSSAPKGDAGDARHGDAVTRDAGDAVTVLPSSDPATWDTGPPLSAEERAAGQARVRELQDEFRAVWGGKR
jgi:hypothetical protein